MQENNAEKYELSDRLRKVREKLHLTQTDIAARWNVTGNYVYLMENKKKPIPLKYKPEIEKLESECGAAGETVREEPPFYWTEADLTRPKTGFEGIPPLELIDFLRSFIDGLPKANGVGERLRMIGQMENILAELRYKEATSKAPVDAPLVTEPKG